MAEPILSIEGVYFRYPNQSEYAVQNVSFQAGRGEWLAIVGHNGSGKSTVARLLIGLLRPERGVIRLFGALSMKRPSGRCAGASAWCFKIQITNLSGQLSRMISPLPLKIMVFRAMK